MTAADGRSLWCTGGFVEGSWVSISTWELNERPSSETIKEIDLISQYNQ